MKKMMFLSAVSVAWLLFCPAAYANELWCLTNPASIYEQAWYVDYTMTVDESVIPVGGVATFTITLIGVIPPECNQPHQLFMRGDIVPVNNVFPNIVIPEDSQSPTPQVWDQNRMAIFHVYNYSTLPVATTGTMTFYDQDAWISGGTFPSITVTFLGAGVTVTDADLVSNKVTVQMSGPGSGALTVTANGASNHYAAITPTGNLAAGTYQVTFDRPKMPVDTYTSITATWNVGPTLSSTFTLPNQWRVLGLVRHSQYNTPAESQCQGPSAQAWVFNSSCQFTQTQLNKKFMDQVALNGTGLSQSYGLLKFSNPNKGGMCASSYPPGATSQNTFLQVSSVTGACNLTLTGGFSVATFPSPNEKKDFTCRDAILLTTKSNTNQAVNEADDYCPSCLGDLQGAQAHIDDYSSSRACRLGDLGKFWTANTHGETQ